MCEGTILKEMYSVESTELNDRLNIGDQNKEKYRKVCVSHFNKCFGHLLHYYFPVAAVKN